MNIDRLHVATDDGRVGGALPAAVYRTILHRALRKHLLLSQMRRLGGPMPATSHGARRRLSRTVDRLIGELPGDCREAMVRCLLENQSPADVAWKLDSTPAKIRRAVQQGLNWICRKLARRGMSVSPRTLARLMRHDARAVRLPVDLAVAANSELELDNERSRRVAELAADFLNTCRQ